MTPISNPHEQLDAALGNPAFPWQRRLLDQLIVGKIPDALDLPTGLGKTAVLAIWLVARAAGARGLPRRLVYVVDRRAVVDQATSEAERLREWVARIPEMGEALGLGEGKLALSTLRGQFVDNRDWCADPSAPAIIVGTVDMIGSRLLFEGYGSSPKMRPFFAGLLGHDTLFVLDESHLVPAFEHLIRSAITDRALRPPIGGLPGCRMLPLSATGGTYAAPLRLDSADRANKVVRERYTAHKGLRVREVTGSLPDAMADQAWELTVNQTARRVLVFANSRKVAEQVRTALEKRIKAERGRGARPTVILFVGGRRVHERTLASEALRSSGFLAGTQRPTDHAFVVATSAGEVGVDLDADDMVADVVPWERMVQRLGRVNRRGHGVARVRLLHEPTSDKTSPTVVDTLTLLSLLRAVGEDSRQGSPESLDELKARHPEAVARATTPAPLRPGLTRPLLDAWSLTSLRDHTGRPEVQPWLRGWIDETPQVTLIWRPLLPPSGAPRAQINAFFQAARPHMVEKLEVYSWQALDWLNTRLKKIDRDPEALGFSAEDVVIHRLDRAARYQESYTLVQLRDLLSARQKKRFSAAISGQTLVLDARIGGLAESGLLDGKEDGPPASVFPTDEPLKGGLSFRVLERAPGEVAPDRWVEIHRSPLIQEEDETTRWLVVDKYRASDVNEDARAAGRPQHLKEHLDWTRAEAVGICARLGLSSQLSSVVTLAARLHDEGKRAERWQRAFRAPRDGVYAKTSGPVNVHALDGYRHEFGSLPYAVNDPEVAGLSHEDRELVLHLIAAHHGNARPTISVGGCDDMPPSALELRARDVALRFISLQDRWGPWGLAWLEALLRSADQRASKLNDERV